MREVTPTKSAALGLGEERKLMRQGFEFLDEKRMLLAGEMLRQLRLYEERAAAFAAEEVAAAEALARAVERHGLDALQVYPRAEGAATPPPCTTTRFLGVMLRQAEPWAATGEPIAAPVDPSAQAEAARAAFDLMMRTSLDIGVSASNLQRLAREYRRVERRAKALENVLLPEVEETLKHVVEQLDLLDQEEAVRVQSAGRARDRAARRA
jgi:V/A-type H+-transporting ATPase subunit D